MSIYEPESLLAIRFIDGLTRDGEMDARFSALGECYKVVVFCAHSSACLKRDRQFYFANDNKGVGELSAKAILMRLGQMIITLLGVSFLTFSLTFIAPGDPVDAILETGDTIVSQETIERTRHELGLDRPFHEQYLSWLNGVVHGDMGRSYSAKIPVQDKLLQNLPGTLFLAGTAIVMMLIISLPAGVISALYRNRWPDQVIRFFTFLGVSMPSFWVGLILLYVFGLKLGLFPIAGGEVSLDRMILPAFTLAILLSSKYTRQVRTAVLEELGQDYVTGLKARGMSMQRILTLLGLSIGWLLGGVAVIEIVFSWPGIGRVAVRAIEARDYPLLQGFVLWIATLYMIVNLIVDISYTYLDPRLRKGAKA